MADPGDSPPPSLLFWTELRSEEPKIVFFGDHPPVPTYLRLWMTGPPLSQGLDPVLHCMIVSFNNLENVLDRKNPHAECRGGSRGGSWGGCRGAQPPPPPPQPEMTCCFLIQLYKICSIVRCVFSAVHIMLLPSQNPSSSYSVLNFTYVTSQ